MLGSITLDIAYHASTLDIAYHATAVMTLMFLIFCYVIAINK